MYSPISEPCSYSQCIILPVPDFSENIIKQKNDAVVLVPILQALV